MQSKIEGVPDGWELVRIGTADKGEFYIDSLGNVIQASHRSICNGYAIIRKIEPPDPGEGWRLLEVGETSMQGDEWHDGNEWKPCKYVLKLDNKDGLIRRRLPRYRPFANAKEFEPHRDRWVHEVCGKRGRIVSYQDAGCAGNSDWKFTWQMLFDTCVFDDDGTPCGVKVE